MRAIGRSIGFLVRGAATIFALWLGVTGLMTLGDGDADASGALLLVVSAVLLVALMRSGRRQVARQSRTAGTPATIMRIWQDPRPGAPAIRWTFVLFDVRGERVKVRLSTSQARQFLDRYSPGDIGRISYRGGNLRSWVPASAATPVRQTNTTAFISYERSWDEDARYVARFLEGRGITSWIDTHELRAGDRLSQRVEDAIGRADAFIPVLSETYMTSPWCLRELETARSRGVPIFPIKVEAGRLVTPPHMRQVLQPILDNTVYVDLRGRDPVRQLEDFAASLVAPR